MDATPQPWVRARDGARMHRLVHPVEEMAVDRLLLTCIDRYALGGTKDRKPSQSAMGRLRVQAAVGLKPS